MSSVINVAKLIWLGFWAALATLVLFFPIITAALAGRTGNSAFSLTRIWAIVMLTVTGVRTSVRGKENIEKGRSYIIISNHQSYFDILALVRRLGIQYRWVIKQELRRVPLFGYALHASRNIYIDRSDQKSAIRSISEGLDRLPPGAGVLFFAEGTRSPDGQIKPFKKGGFVMAVERGMPILPVTVNGSRKVMPKSSLFFSSGSIEVVVAPPIETGEYRPVDLDRLIEKTRAIVIDNFDSDYPADLKD